MFPAFESPKEKIKLCVLHSKLVGALFVLGSFKLVATLLYVVLSFFFLLLLSISLYLSPLHMHFLKLVPSIILQLLWAAEVYKKNEK